jgi:M6 family metalloprotease-like protein
MSYGKLTIVGKVFGWYMLPYREYTYGRDCVAVDDADCSGSDGSWQIAADIIAPAQADVNFNDYDYFVFVHSGNGEESSGVRDDVWSVAYLSGVYVRTNSKSLTKFDIVPETEARGSVPLGVYCHEFGHLLGLPDMYDTHSGKSRMGNWELMDKGLWNGHPAGSTPSELSSWSRIRLGWLSPSNIMTFQLDSAERQAIVPLETPPANNSITTVMIPIGENEYYLFENRQSIGNDAALPDHGLVGYHINEDQSDFSTIQTPAALAALHLGDLMSVSQVKAKVIAAFQTGVLLVGFGRASDEPTQPGSVLNLIVIPPLSVNVIVNNQTYTIDQTSGQVTIVSEFSNTTFQINLPPTVNIQTGVRERFQTWDDGFTNSTRTILVPANATLAASYRRQYLVSVSGQHSTPSGSGWYDENSQATISLPSPVDASTGTRYVFNTWLGDLTGRTNPARFRVTQPMNITAAWLRLESMQLTFFDMDNTPVPPSKIDKLTLKAPNGTVLVFTKLKTNATFWFLKGRYRVLTANVLNVDSVSGNEQFASSPNGLARVSLELYTMKFMITDYILGSPLEGGSVTITLPNNLAETKQIQNGNVTFNQLPHASYPYTISRDWTLQVSGATILPNQRTTNIKMVAGSTLAIIMGTISLAIITSLLAFKLFHTLQRRREEAKETANDEFLSRWYQRIENKKQSN